MRHQLSFIAFAIEQGGFTHDCIKSLDVVDVRDGEVMERYAYHTSPDSLADIWVDVADCFEHHDFAIAYNLSTHRSNLEKSLTAVGIDPPVMKYLCAYNWGKSVTGHTDSLDIQQVVGRIGG
jgi:hypothetical protein